MLSSLSKVTDPIQMPPALASGKALREHAEMVPTKNWKAPSSKVSEPIWVGRHILWRAGGHKLGVVWRAGGAQGC